MSFRARLHGKCIAPIWTVLTTLAVLLLAFQDVALAESVDERFCVVPVANAARGGGLAGETWRQTETRFDIPRLSAPVFTPASHPWTLDTERHVVPYEGPYPHSYFDTGNWIDEPWSGRIVALTYGGGVSVLAPGEDHFDEIPASAGETGHRFTAIATFSGRHLTVVVEHTGAVFAVADKALEPWLSKDDLAAEGIHGIQRLYDSPLLSAVIIRDTDDVLHLLTADGKWYRLGAVEHSISGYFVDAPASGAALLIDQRSVVAIRKSSDGTVSFTLETFSGQHFYVSKLFGQLIGFRRPFLTSGRWQRLTPSGFADIPGGTFADGPYVHDLPTLGRTMFGGDDGLYLYDGAEIKPINGAGRQRFSSWPSIYDLSSIGRVLIATQSGIFEVTRSAELVPRPMPFPANGAYPKPQLADWPKAGVALVLTRLGLFVLNRDLSARPILGGDQIGLGGLDFAQGEMAATGDLILSARNGIFLAVDGNKDAGSAICQHEREVRRAVPESTLCLRDISGTDETSIGFAIGGMIEAPLNQGLLIDTVRGLFLQRSDGSFENLEPRSGQYTRGLVALPWSDEVLATGPESTIVRSDLSLEQLHQWVVPKAIAGSIEGAVVSIGNGERPPLLLRAENGKYQLRKVSMTPVAAALDTPWFGGVLLSNRAGLALLGRDGGTLPFSVSTTVSKSRPPLYGDSYSRMFFHASDFFAIDRFKTIFVRQQPGRWFRLTKDREWLSVPDLPDELVLTHFDPGQGDVLFGMGSGIYAVGLNGAARKIEGPGAPSHVIRTFARAGNSVIAGGDEGLFELSGDLSGAIPIANGSAATIGSVSEIVAVEFAGIDIIKATDGTYAFENGKLTRVRDLSAAGRAENLTAFPHLRRVLAMKPFESGPLLFELGRNDQSGQCTRPMVAPH